MWFWYMVSVVSILFTVYVLTYAICLRQLQKRYNTYNYYDRSIKCCLYEISNYIQLTIDTLLAQDLPNKHPVIETLQEINSHISSPYEMSSKDIRSNITEIAKILNQGYLPEGLERKITKELSKADITCEQNQTYYRHVSLYNHNIHHFFYPLKILFSKPSR